MTIQKITREYSKWQELEALAIEAFPPEEYLSPSKLLEMSTDGTIDFLAVHDNGIFVGFIVTSVYESICYLFFLAISSDHRSKGYGSKILKLLEELYPDKKQVVDFEMVDEKADNYKQRTTRKAFYVRNGYKETGCFISYLGVEYEIMCKDESFEINMFKQMMKRFKIDGFNPVYRSTNERLIT